ncbi:hypothetical protein SERLA73DRAFT_150306 [Serpula lacrymans var. lacrymans S7.3]|uniref:DUF6589 domain-containing protein n=1 Tax=Serpula lacrymans var. lacrymans (strain S7.3) TaxID=936435 RepID=F8PM01_SERL3|nr:hypothetical protein SERLA73DRAFT_150306 [Serpula lacrymans var. lacrymans S7.3]
MFSSDELENMLFEPPKKQDQVCCRAIRWNCDALRYLNVINAVQNGNIGIMQDSLLHLLYQFAGGGNSKYTIEVLEVLQCIHYEWPPEVWLLLLCMVHVKVNGCSSKSPKDVSQGIITNGAINLITRKTIGN